jgi:hypothetical protein
LLVAGGGSLKQSHGDGGGAIGDGRVTVRMCNS